MHGETDTRQQILQAALKWFARKGYAGTSVSDIVTTARVSRPVLYYYFGSKAGLYRALVDWAAEERLRLMREAVTRAATLAGQLREIAVTMFEFACANRELMRLAFATAVAASGEVPEEAECFKKGFKSFLFLEDLIRRGQENGELTRRFDTRALAMGFAGLMHLHVLLHVLRPDQPLDRTVAETLVEVFLHGAAPGRAENHAPKRTNAVRRNGHTSARKKQSE
jgi:TetR/AcrR family transcriptional regulator